MAVLKVFTFTAVFLVCLSSVLGDACSSNYLYCSNGCCGTYQFPYCCTYSYTETSFTYVTNIPLIVGCTIGGIAFVCFLVAFICCMKRRGYAGRVLYGTGGAAASTTVVQSNTSQTLSTFPTAPQPYPYPMVVQPNPMGAPPYPTYPMGAQSFQPPENKIPDQQFACNGYTNAAFQPPPYTQK